MPITTRRITPGRGTPLPSRTPAPAAAKLTDRIGRQGLATPAEISAALAGDHGVQSFLRSMSGLGYRVEPKALEFCSFLFGRQLMPIMGKMSVPQATEALGFLDKQPITAAAKGAVISGIFPDKGQALAVARSFVDKFGYSNVEMNGRGSADRTQLVSAANSGFWEEIPSIASQTHLAQEIIGALTMAATPKELDVALARII